jgi:hypothetical protein
MFLLGIHDSMSIGWVHKLLFCMDPVSRKIHPSSTKLFKSLKSSVIQVVVFLFIIPFILQNILKIQYIAFVTKVFFLLLSYGYLFFHNEDILASSR